ncbi:7-carboxy-7-deazaguanine synthase QueE [Shouchella miscanthi]|uniref:7-carboxy-7-deazaguanine synthase n=1 Tax=Shouchella miscanthi TaxID=2598861 RepID=A0ABU6NEV9_9BACI|nr:radical SAM protein [Shouchella miscanthi]MED4126732.1 4Fe-4S cluster-binding domain-containing protein [Shouchella miscanthi]
MEERKIPMVEIFETIEGEGTNAGFATTFIRLFGCNLRCTWCDTPYSYTPAKPEFYSTIEQIIRTVDEYKNPKICLTGGEPLLSSINSTNLLNSLSEKDYIDDIHVETNGAINLKKYHEVRLNNKNWLKKVRFIVDYKLPDSGENEKMIHDNFDYLNRSDEVKFVIASDEDFNFAVNVLNKYHKDGLPLFSPVWESMPPSKLAAKILKTQLTKVKLNLQLHKIIWDPQKRGV